MSKSKLLILKIALAISIILLLLLANLCRIQYIKIHSAAINNLQYVYSFLTNPDDGSSTWNTKETWNDNVFPLTLLDSMLVDGPAAYATIDEPARKLLHCFIGLDWSNPVRPEVVKKANELQIAFNNTPYKWSSTVEQGNLQEIIDLIDRSQNNPSTPAAE